MQWVLWMIAVAVLGLAAVGASGRLGELPGTVTDTPRPHIPTGVLSGDDLRGLRFAVVPRGYSMDQVDELLDRLARQLDAASRHPAASGSVGDHPAEATDEPVRADSHSTEAAGDSPSHRESSQVVDEPVSTQEHPVDTADDSGADGQPAPAGGSEEDSGHQAEASGIMDGVSSQPERG